jgi:tetratricopeptide (TPR) repeat protein
MTTRPALETTMSELTREVLATLTLVAALCGLLLFAVAIGGLIIATVRVGCLGRVLVIPFRGADSGRVEITGLFMSRLLEMEEEWTASALEIRELRDHFVSQSPGRFGGPPIRRNPGDGDSAPRPSPLVDGRPLETSISVPSRQGGTDLGTAPRTVGDDFLDDILLLNEAGSVAGADVGSLSIAGVSFSPHQILAVLRRIPGLSARRVISGAMISTGAVVIVTVSYEERSLRGRTRRARCTTEIAGDDWLPSLERLAFQLATARIHLLRNRHDTTKPQRRDALRCSGSRAADRTVIEAQSWKACNDFLRAYILHLRHYISGNAADRERALERYRAALQHQPDYTRAAYNCATLLYNRYLPDANQEAMTLFAAATASDDVHDRALACAGLTMSYGQAIHRFGSTGDDLVSKALQASEDAIELAPDLEEARFARAWAHQLREAWDEAINAYESVTESQTPSPPGRRIVSAARNNTAWILLHNDPSDQRALARAECLLWDALSLYPSKSAYANLAEIARRCHRHDDALTLLSIALRLDPTYVNGWNERACLEIEIAALSAAHGDGSAAQRYLAEAAAHHARAVALTQDAGYAASLRKGFNSVLDAHALADTTPSS